MILKQESHLPTGIGHSKRQKMETSVLLLPVLNWKEFSVSSSLKPLGKYETLLNGYEYILFFLPIMMDTRVNNRCQLDEISTIIAESAW